MRLCRRTVDALESGDIDLALVTQPCGRSGGQAIHREPLVWAAARGTAPEAIDPLPLALFGPGCIYREAATEALDQAGRDWRHAYNSASRDGLDVAVDAGLAITIVPKRAMKPNWRVLDEGFPVLEEMELLLYRSKAAGAVAIDSLAETIVETLAEAPRAAA